MRARMKVIFMGAPAFAVPPLRVISDLGEEIVGVFTKAPRAAGRRGLQMKRTAVHEEAERLGLPVFTPLTLRGAEPLSDLEKLQADVAIVAAYGLLLPEEILQSPRLGCFNLHASLLPRWRGAAPIQRAIMAGDAESGVSIMKMEVGLDTGPIAGEVRTAIEPSETAEDLLTRLSLLAAKTLKDNWGDLVGLRLRFAPQDGSGVTYARKIDKTETPIDWAMTAEAVRGHIQGLSPFPGAHASFASRGASEVLRVLRAKVVDGDGTPGVLLDDQLTVACGHRAVRLLQVQRSGRNVIAGSEFMRSGALRVGDTFEANVRRPS
jgi:methionyl-tRNA formyltransferase